MIIRKLDDKTISKIAAGEVVERPASIIKELMENSIDAGAKNIEVIISKGDPIEITVKDDGIGMTEDEILKSIQNHTTSKISQIDDLTKITTYGFRGEALASICSVSELSIASKTREQKIGTKVEFKEGRLISKSSIAMKDGTQIVINNLFHNIPARRKFLKTYNTEISHIIDVFRYFALIQPDIKMKLIKDKKIIYNLPVEDRAARIKNVLRIDIDSKFNKIYYDGTIKISGYVMKPDYLTGKKVPQHLFINGRHVKDKIVAMSVIKAYEGFAPKGIKPAYIIYMEIPNDLIDINVHPRKTEVRFVDNDLIWKGVYESIRTSLESDKQADHELKFGSLTKSRNPQLFNKTRKTETNYGGVYEGHINNNRREENLIKLETYKKLFTPVNRDKVIGEKYVKEDKDQNLIQLFNSIILVVKQTSVLFIDQHAAAERITFEKLKYGRSEIAHTSIILNLKEDAEIIINNKDIIEKLGIRFEDIGGGDISITELPIELKNSDLKELLSDIATHLKQGIIPINGTAESDAYFASMACHQSIRANQPLTVYDMQKLISDLFKCKNPYSCPHGRPIVWELTKEDINKKFKR